MKNHITQKVAVIAAVVALTMVGGCSTPKNIDYYADATPETVIAMMQERPIVVQPGNKLSIMVNTRDASVSSMFNLPIYSSTFDATSGLRAGNATGLVPQKTSTTRGIALYTVDSKGDIDFPVLGKLHVAGMSREEIAAYIKGQLMGRDLVKDPTVTVEVENAGFNVLGEVRVPGRYQMNNDKITITEAMAMAGDVKLTGLKENVKVFRKEADGMHTYVVDLTKANDVLKSPVYYLKQDDVIYVEPNNLVKRATEANGNTVNTPSFWISIASVMATLATTVGIYVNR